MTRTQSRFSRAIAALVITCVWLAACGPAPAEPSDETAVALPQNRDVVPTAGALPTPLPTRESFSPGELVEYAAQSGDTLAALAKRFNTTEVEIREANPSIPPDATTMPPGMPMQIPIYFRALWGSPFQILPDAAFVNGPAGIGFNTTAFVESHPGWLTQYADYPSELGATRSRARLSGAEIVDYVATNYSVSPRLLLAILEYQAGALSQPGGLPRANVLGLRRLYYASPYLQLVLAANHLNSGYYRWRAGEVGEFELADGTLFRPDPWQNAGTVAIQYYFAQALTAEEFERAISPAGFQQTYRELFGDPWSSETAVLPGSLLQPHLRLPFQRGQVWTFTGGPHTGFGTGEPFAALDFAPPSEKSGCFIPAETDFATAVADGLVVRSGTTGVALDLDEDGDERTGWVIYYLHLAAESRAPLGKELSAGDFIGYPSCESGHATGTHVHIARKFNGEWILADGPLAFTMEGWTVHNGSRAYLGTLTRAGLTVVACECSDKSSWIVSEGESAN